MRVIITGAHLSPALAVAKELKRRKFGVIFVGRKHALEGDTATSFEYRIIKKLGYKFKSLTAGRFQRKWTKNTIPSLVKIPIGFKDAYKIVQNTKPDVTLSFGGYTSLPVVASAFLAGIPIVIHEQTLGAGLANKIAALFASRILISWKQSRKFFPKNKTLLTGNPIREEITSKIRNSKFEIRNLDKNLPLVYITGGSLGSHTINVAVEQIIDRILKKFIVIHQTGESSQYRDYERLRKLREQLPKILKERYFIRKFIDLENIGWVMGNAALVVGRAGANTVNELLFLKKPAVLIPIPFSGANEQNINANFLKNIGLAEVIAQNKLTPKLLEKTIKKMITSKKNYTIRRSVNFNFENSAKKIAEVVTREAKRKTGKEKST